MLHDTAQFEKVGYAFRCVITIRLPIITFCICSVFIGFLYMQFLKETSHHKLELIEKSKLLKAEKDMEVALGMSRTEVQRMEKL